MSNERLETFYIGEGYIYRWIQVSSISSKCQLQVFYLLMLINKHVSVTSVFVTKIGTDIHENVTSG